MGDTSGYNLGYRAGYFWGRQAELHGEPYDERTLLERRRAEDCESDEESDAKDA